MPVDKNKSRNDQFGLLQMAIQEEAKNLPRRHKSNGRQSLSVVGVDDLINRANINVRTLKWMLIGMVSDDV